MASENGETQFLFYFDKLKQLKISDVYELNSLIDQLNALDFRHVKISSRDVEEILCLAIQLVPKENDHLLTKLCSLIYLLFNKQERIISEGTAEAAANFFLTALQSCGECFLHDVLMGLSALVLYNGDKVEKFYGKFLGDRGVLIDLLESEKHGKSIQYSAMSCILHLLSKNFEKIIELGFFPLCYLKLMEIIKKNMEQNESDILSLKIMTTAIKCLHCLFLPKHSLCDNLGELLGILKCLLFYGLPGPAVSDYVLHPTLPAFQMKQMEDSQTESDSTVYPKLRKQKKVRRSKHKKDIQKKDQGDGSPRSSSRSEDSSIRSFADLRIRSSSSDSEYSDAESSLSKIKSHQASVRQLAYQVLQNVVKNTDKKIIFGYWSSFLPDHPAIPGMAYGQNIFTTILKDPNTQVRLSALVLLTEMLRGSKTFLSVADGKSTRHSSFTSLSSIVATIITELHRCLLLALLSESSSLLLTQILKCYAVLCENTPYSQLNDDIILKLLKHVKGFTHHQDCQVQIASLIVLQFIVKSDLVPENVGSVIISPDLDSAINEFGQPSKLESSNGNEAEVPWLVYVCQKNILSDEPLAVKIESVQLLSCIVGKYFYKIYSTVPLLEEVILLCLADADESLQLHGAKLLDVFGRCLSSPTASIMKEDLKLKVDKVWEKIISGPFIANLTNEDQKPLLAVCCDCLSTVPVEVFENLPPKQQIFYITVLLGLASDANGSVRGAAVRCLGVYCLFPSLMQDFSFLCDVSQILIKCVDDPLSNVRCKASWSVGKLSDALFENENSLSQDQISEQFFYSTAMACVQYSKDCDKVRANSFRALGIFLNHLPEKWIESTKTTQFVKNSSAALLSALTSNTMKVCWNVCYALSNMLKNTNLVTSGLIELDEIFGALLKSLKSPNFKVRISAAHALTVMQSRDLYRTLFPKVWLQLLEALQSANTDVNFKEIKHQENLSDQICYSICQLTTMLSPEDFPLISKESLELSEVLFTSMWKFGCHTSSDKFSTVCSAIENLDFISQNAKSSHEQLTSVLKDILNQVTIAFYGQDTN